MDIFGAPLEQFGEWGIVTQFVIFQVIGQVLGLLHIPSVLLRRSQQPMAQLTWILCLLTVPYLGVVLWWAIGRTHLKRKRRRRARARQEVSRGLAKLDRPLTPPELPDSQDGDALALLKRQAMLVSDNDVFPTTGGNNVRILFGGREAYPAFEEAIRAARHHVHVQFYIWQRDAVGERLRDLLVQKAREGVEVRLLYDAIGASAVSYGGFMDPLREAGGQVAPFLPFRLERSLRVNFRNHRKIVIVDGEVGFTGGLNVGEEYFDWYDIAFRVQGHVVNQLQEVFAEDWFFATEESISELAYFDGVTSSPVDGDCGDVVARVVASGPDSVHAVIHAMFFIAITSARERIWITTPYFIPDGAIMTALRTAAMRGVDVRLLLPGKSDVPVAQTAGRGYFDELLEAGVRIYEYEPSVLHAKILTFDDRWAIVGSANMDNRSFRLQFEVNLALESEEINDRLCADFRERLLDAEEIDPVQWRERGRWSRLKEALARLLSPVL